MKKHFIIDFLCAGVASAVMLTGCAGNTTQYCTAGMGKIESRDYEGAIAEFNAVISKNASNRDAYRGLGIAYYRMGNTVLAEEKFEEVLKRSADKYDDIHIDAMKYYAECLFKSGEYSKAVEYYSILLDKCDKEETADFYFLRGCSYVRLNDENNGALDFEKAISNGRNDYVTFCSMYNEFKMAGYNDRAESYLKRVINDAKAGDLLIGKTYFIFGNYELAESRLLAASDNGYGEAGYYLAMTYEAEGRYVEAEELYQTYMSRNYEDANIYNQYGSYLINRQNYENALAYIEKGLDYAEGDTKRALMYNQAVCYEYMGNFTQAYNLLDTYLNDYPDDEQALREFTFLTSRI